MLEFQPSPFFAEQLTAFELWLQHGSKEKKPPEQLPIVLQVDVGKGLHRMLLPLSLHTWCQSYLIAEKLCGVANFITPAPSSLFPPASQLLMNGLIAEYVLAIMLQHC